MFWTPFNIVAEEQYLICESVISAPEIPPIHEEVEFASSI